MRVLCSVTGQWVSREQAMTNKRGLCKPQPTPDCLWTDAEAYGNYLVRAEDQSYTIFPKNPRTGESMRVHCPKFSLQLRHIDTDAVVEFSHYRTMGRWFWRDSREPKRTLSRADVLETLSRMVRGEQVAVDLLRRHLAG